MSMPELSEPIEDGTYVKIHNPGFKRARVAEYLGRLGRMAPASTASWS